MYGLGKKIGMTRLFVNGVHTPVTVIEFNEQQIVQKKTKDRDGYNAIQIGVGAKSAKKSSNAHKGHIKKHTGKTTSYAKLAEFKDVEIADDKTIFDINDISTDTIFHITGTTIGRGFAGGMKRHGFHGQPQTHGHDHVRAVGSIGARWPQRVIKGKKMAGHFGAAQRTVRSVPVVAVDPELKLVFVKGSVPGANNSYLKLMSA